MDRRKLLTAGAAAMVATPAAARATGWFPPDDILGLIQKHRDAFAYELAALEVSGGMLGNSPEVMAAEAETCRRSHLVTDVEAEMLTSPPVTSAGWVALIDYVMEHEANGVDFIAEIGEDEPYSFKDAMLMNISAWLRAPR
jgi:hypothetical protein